MLWCLSVLRAFAWWLFFGGGSGCWGDEFGTRWWGGSNHAARVVVLVHADYKVYMSDDGFLLEERTESAYWGSKTDTIVDTFRGRPLEQGRPYYFKVRIHGLLLKKKNCVCARVVVAGRCCRAVCDAVVGVACVVRGWMLINRGWWVV